MTRPVNDSPPPIAPRPPTVARVVGAYLLLPHAVPIIVVLLATAGFALLAADGPPPAATLARLLLAMLGGQVLIGAVNELVDADLDAATKPWKPIAAGLVSRQGARRMAFAGALLMLGCGIGFGAIALALLVLGTGLGLLYDLWLKRTAISWVPYLLALPLLPIWVWAALTGFDPRLLLLYPLGAPAVVGVHLAQALPDTASDRAAGVHHPASLLGERRTIVAAWGATLLAPVLAMTALVLAPGVAARPAVIAAAAAVVVGLVGLDVLLYLWRPRTGVMACFPCVAGGTVALGIGWVLGVAL